MEKSGNGTGVVIKLILYFSAVAFVSCKAGKVGDFYFGDYQGERQQRISISADTTFTYSIPGLMGEPNTLNGTWIREGNNLLLHPKPPENRKLVPEVTITKDAGTSKDRLLISAETGVNVFLEVVVNGTKVGEISRSDSIFVFEGELNQLQLNAYATGLYAALFQNDTLRSGSISFSELSHPAQVVVRTKVSLRDFYHPPVEKISLQIKGRRRLYWNKQKASFYWNGL